MKFLFVAILIVLAIQLAASQEPTTTDAATTTTTTTTTTAPATTTTKATARTTRKVKCNRTNNWCNTRLPKKCKNPKKCIKTIVIVTRRRG